MIAERRLDTVGELVREVDIPSNSCKFGDINGNGKIVDTMFLKKFNKCHHELTVNLSAALCNNTINARTPSNASSSFDCLMQSPIKASTSGNKNEVIL